MYFRKRNPRESYLMGEATGIRSRLDEITEESYFRVIIAED